MSDQAVDKLSADLDKPSNSYSESTDGPTTLVRDFKFYAIIVSLLVATFLSALDLTATATALPKIAQSLKATDYTWIGNAYSIGSVAIIPWSGGLANIFGRRPVFLVGLAFFFVGSVLCGAAVNMNMMLSGRSFQGVGSGIILTLTEVVLADLVPLSERGTYQGAFGATWALASATGPPIGGALASAYWPSLFYINLPLTIIVACCIGFFLNLKKPSGTAREKIQRMDFLGNAIFIPSITLLIIGLCWGNQPYPWSSAHVLAPLIIGGFGLVLWFLVERYHAEHPTVPFKLLQNWTSAVGFVTTFIHGIVALAVFYFLPAYFQSTKGDSPVLSAIHFFPVAFVVAPFAMLAGGTISATQIYKPQNVIAWVLITIGAGLMSLLSATSPLKAWVPLPIVMAMGLGLLYAATTFPVLAPLPPHLAGQALAFLVFIRSFGNVLGITIGSTVLANELRKRLPVEFIEQIPGGITAAYSAIPIVKNLPEPLRTEVRKAWGESIRVIWLVMIPFGGIGFIISLFMKQMKLETVTDEQWGMKEKKIVSEDSDDV